MPIYDLQCTKCKRKQKDMAIKLADYDKPIKCKCGAEMERVIFSHPVQFNCDMPSPTKKVRQ
jgi:putative FmdB family regulatory protein